MNTLSGKLLNDANVAGDTENAGNWNAGGACSPLPNLGESVATGLSVPGPQKWMPGISGVRCPNIGLVRNIGVLRLGNIPLCMKGEVTEWFTLTSLLILNGSGFSLDCLDKRLPSMLPLTAVSQFRLSSNSGISSLTLTSVSL